MPSLSKFGTLAAACLVGAAQTAGSNATAADLDAELSIEIEHLHVFDAPGPEPELDDASATVEGAFSLVLPGGAGIHTQLTFEPVTDTERDRYFKDFGLYVEELYLSTPLGEGEVRIGKFNMAFGLANDEAPGLFGDGIAGEYELTERIGVAAQFPLAFNDGEHVLTAAVFMADTTPLSDSMLTSRGRLHRGDGGVSNTDAPASVMVAMSGTFGGSGYSAGLRYQLAGTGSETDEFGGVLGLTHEFDGEEFEAVLLGEIAYFPNFDGESEPVAFVTLAAAAEFGDVTLSAVYGLHCGRGAGDGHLATIGLGYALTDNLTISAGYRALEEEGSTTHAAGLQMTFEFELP